jgi:hypothetical protein
MEHVEPSHALPRRTSRRAGFIGEASMAWRPVMAIASGSPAPPVVRLRFVPFFQRTVVSGIAMTGPTG